MTKKRNLQFNQCGWNNWEDLIQAHQSVALSTLEQQLHILALGEHGKKVNWIHSSI